MTFQDQSNGGVALWAFNTDTNAIVWKTIVGVPWLASPAPLPDGGISLIAPNGREVELDAERIKQGGFVIDGVPRPGDFSLPAGQRLQLKSAGKTIEAIVPRDGTTELWVQDPCQAVRLAEDQLAGRTGRRAHCLGRRGAASRPRRPRLSD